MHRRGIALIFSLLVVVVLSILAASFFLRSINENNLVRRYVNSTRAFWLAEAGIAEGIINLPNDTSGCIGGSNYCYAVDTSLLPATTYYQIDSTGSVTLPQGGSIQRRLIAVVDSHVKFEYAIETTVDLVIQGNVDIDSQNPNSALNFADSFGCSKAEMESYATHSYTDPDNNVSPCNGITWVDVSSGSEFMITSENWSGSGILVVNGDAQITGGHFNGIIYVIGKLRMSGNPTINGSIIAESDTELVEDTTITGRVTINYDVGAITTAIMPLEFIPPEIVSWREAQ
jgi:hypothetical protein